MDIQTKDGIFLRNIPDGTPDEAIKARIDKIRNGVAPTPVSKPLEPAPVSEGPLRQTLRKADISLTPFDAPNIEPAAYKAGGAVTDAATNAGMSPEVAGGAGYLTNVATQAVPAAFGGQIGSKIGSAGQWMGEKLMRMALKPSPSMGAERAAEAVKTMLTADAGNILPGANVTAGGIAGLQARREVLAKAVDDALANSTATVNKYDVAKSAGNALDKAGNQVAPISDTNSVLSTINEFLHKNPKVPSRTPAQVVPPQTVQSPVLGPNGQPFTTTIPGKTIPASGTDEIPVRLAQELKQGTYANLGDKAYKGTELKAADVNAQKDLARGLRMEIEKQVPAVGPLNAEQSQIINAVKAAISRDAVAGNKDPIGLGFIASNPAAAAGFAANRSELVKSMLARLLYSGSKPTGTAIGTTAGGLFANQGEE